MRYDDVRLDVPRSERAEHPFSKNPIHAMAFAVLTAAMVVLCAAPTSALADEPDGAAVVGAASVAGVADEPAADAAAGIAGGSVAAAGAAGGSAAAADAADEPDGAGKREAADNDGADKPAAEAAADAAAEPEAVAADAKLTGWQKIEGKWYYYDKNGNMVTGWYKPGNYWFYLDPEKGFMYADDVFSIKGSLYYFDTHGHMVTGWQKIYEDWYYFNDQGHMLFEWQKIGDLWYYLHPEGGSMVTGYKKIGGKMYLFADSGRMLTGWQRVNEKFPDAEHADVFFDSNGAASGMIRTTKDGKLLVSDESLKTLTGWSEIGGSWFFSDKEGIAQTGWLKRGGSWYHMAGNGRMDTGWLEYDGDWYYLYGSGRMATDDTVDGYYLSGSGRWITDSDLIYANSFYSDTNYLIIVDTDSNWVTIYKGAKGFRYEVRSFPCSSGAYSTPTVTGTFEVGEKGYVFGHGNYRCYYYTQFYGDYLFHSVLYRPGGGILDGRLGYHISHGCVRLDIDDAEWIYDNVPSGSTVRVD